MKIMFTSPIPVLRPGTRPTMEQSFSEPEWTIVALTDHSVQLRHELGFEFRHCGTPYSWATVQQDSSAAGAPQPHAASSATAEGSGVARPAPGTTSARAKQGRR